MHLHVLGTAGYHPNDRRQTTCVMIPEFGIMLDAGTAVYRVRDLLQTETLDILISHAHLDHVVGLTYLLDVLQGKDVSVRVFGEASKLDAIKDHIFHPAIFPVEPPYESVPLVDPFVLNGSARVSFVRLEHPGGSIGYRIDWPARSLAFITDTTASGRSDYIDFVRDVDVLIHECNFADGSESMASLTGHSCTSSVAEVAKRASVGRLILIHVNHLTRVTIRSGSMSPRRYSRTQSWRTTKMSSNFNCDNTKKASVNVSTEARESTLFAGLIGRQFFDSY